MKTTAPLTVLSTVLATAAFSAAPHLPLGATGEQVQRLTLLPGPTFTSPARGVAAPAKTEVPTFNASLRTPPEPPQFQFKENLMNAPGKLTLGPASESTTMPFAAPAPANKEPLPATAPRFEEKFRAEK